MSELPPQDPINPISSTTPASAAAPTTPVSYAPGTTVMGDPADVEKNKIFAILSYFGILVLIPILAAKDSKFARYHANQGLVFFICAFIGSIIFFPMAAVLVFIPYLGLCLSPVLMGCWSLCMLAMLIIGVINAIGGKMKPLPVIGKFTILK